MRATTGSGRGSARSSGHKPGRWLPGALGTRGRFVGPVLAVLVAGVLAGCSGAGVPSVTPAPDLVTARRAAGIEDCPQTTAAPVPGGLPDLELDCLGGDTTAALAGLRGPMVVNFWAQWCLPCRQEAPVLQAFHAAHGDEVALLGIDYDDPEPGWAIEFAQLAGWTWPQLVDPDKTTEAPLGLPGIPMSVLLDVEGRVVARHAGAFDNLAELEDWVDEGLGR